MQTLEIINVGEAPNDGTGDEHRTAFQKVNANFGKIVEGFAEVDSAIHEVSNSAQAAADAAQAAGDAAQAAAQAAGAAIPASQKGELGGVAPLNSEGKLPEEYLPDEFIPVDERGVAGGVATLGVDGKVSPEQLPNAVDAIPLAEKGQAGGVATLDPDGLVPADQLPPIPSGPAVGTPNWWPLRASVPAGQIPQDGQEVSRTTYPDLAAMVIAGTLPVVAEATWQSDPTQRGKYTLGDGSTTIRVPDLNGKSAGSLGAVVRRGDGAMSAGTGGLIQRDALQNITGGFETRRLTGSGLAIVVTPAAGSGAMAINESGPTRDRITSDSTTPAASAAVTFDASRVARTADETRALNVTGIWTVHAFGAVVNPGSADAAQLASDYAVLNATVQSLSGTVQTLSDSVQTLSGQMAQAFGVNQSMQNVGSGRAPNTNYTNSTGRMIIVTVSVTLTGANGRAIAYLDDNLAGDSFNPTSAASLGIQLDVPAGSSYRIVPVAANITLWREYR